MAHKRKNKSPRPRGFMGALPWFIANVRRQRRRAYLAKLSRRKNR